MITFYSWVWAVFTKFNSTVANFRAYAVVKGKHL